MNTFKDLNWPINWCDIKNVFFLIFYIKWKAENFLKLTIRIIEYCYKNIQNVYFSIWMRQMLSNNSVTRLLFIYTIAVKSHLILSVKSWYMYFPFLYYMASKHKPTFSSCAQICSNDAGTTSTLKICRLR